MLAVPKISELLHLKIDDRRPKYRQIYEYIKQAIIKGQLQQQVMLPPSRVLAADLKLARSTIQRAYDQLKSEGYIHSKLGSGIFVCADIPDDYVNVCKKTHLIKKQAQTKQPNLTFTPGISDLNHFPTTVWRRLLHSTAGKHYKKLLISMDDLGDASLRQAITEYLIYARGVDCNPEQILITTGAQEAINLCLQTLLQANEVIAIENPGYRGAYNVAKRQQCNIMPIPVEEDGFDVDFLGRKKTIAKLIYVTPSHQYPLCMTLPISKRLQLLNYAQQHNSFILEDDYDSEFHYHTHPTPAMQGLGFSERVIYMGTFSKVLFPALRLGYLILPESLLKPFTQAKILQFGRTPTINQLVTSEFIKQGYFIKHIKKMRLHYAQKYQQLITACQKYLSTDIRLFSQSVGLHICLQFPPQCSINEQNFILQLNQQGLYPVGLSEYYYQQQQTGLVIGFGTITNDAIEPAIKKLAKLYQQEMVK